MINFLYALGVMGIIFIAELQTITKRPKDQNCKYRKGSIRRKIQDIYPELRYIRIKCQHCRKEISDEDIVGANHYGYLFWHSKSKYKKCLLDFSKFLSYAQHLIDDYKKMDEFTLKNRPLNLREEMQHSISKN